METKIVPHTENQTGEALQDVRNVVREHYGQIALEVLNNPNMSCCAPLDGTQASCCGSGDDTALSRVIEMYQTSDVAELPSEVTGLSLGCGDPITLASLKPGQTVLDLGSGGGIDCFLAAKQVGETGYVIGVDMTPPMLEKARANKARVGAKNVDFRLGEIEHLPVADSTVDVVISNCVINLSPDKPQVFREAYRVLKPGGRLAVSDVVTNGPLPQGIKNSLSAWAGCIAGALEAEDYINAIENAGFVDVELIPVYMDHAIMDDAVEQLGLSEYVDRSNEDLYQAVFSAKVTARKPDD